ncbi:MAG: hypothetical protein F2813_04245 [Actinobacteria bacterium]|uniref:Unannotated protein n=1 Tax=freshwater metagenome TaxID=449393 RepID=A0A6J5ZWW7_9ZZZZ|nr:hypothetical protein [Actinomycetota bacterium]
MASLINRQYSAYRAGGADLPFGDQLPYHGVAMEGYFWRITDPASGRVVIALIGVNRAADGHWSTLGLAGYPNRFLWTVAHPEGAADSTQLGASAGGAFRADEQLVQVDLGEDARLELKIDSPRPWPKRRLGGSSIFQAVPALNQYWHPWLLGGSASGSARLGDDYWEFDGAQVYAEKNWGKGGFPPAWWWGQAQGFEEPQVCVAFAGGVIESGPLRTEVTAVVVLMPDGTLIRLGDPIISPVEAEVSDEHWRLSGRSARWSVEIDGYAPLGAAHVLPVPLPAERRNVPGAIEHLGGEMNVVVRRHGRVAWRGRSELAALEHGGIDRARAEVTRRGGGPDAADAAAVEG